MKRICLLIVCFGVGSAACSRPEPAAADPFHELLTYDPPLGLQENRAGRLREAERLIAAHRNEAAVEILQEFLLVDPKDADALLCVARAYWNLARDSYGPAKKNRRIDASLKAAEYLRRYLKVAIVTGENEKTVIRNVLYNEACAKSLMGDKEGAVASLRQAIDAGFVNYSHIDTDVELDPIRNHPEYKRLMSRFRLR